MTRVLAAAEYGGAWTIPPVEELFTFPAIFGEGTIYEFDRVALLALSAALFVGLLFYAGLRKPKLVPGKMQLICESIVDFIRDQVALQVMGPAGRKWVPYLTTLFMFIWINNSFEIVPLINFPPTSRMALPFFLTFITYFMFIIAGMYAQGPFRYFKDAIFVPGVPKPLYLLVAPIELVSTFIVRPLTLMIRLFANMLAGHILLTIIFITCHAFLALRPGLPIGIIALAAAPLMIGFEFVVGLLQAYIFAILTAVYVGDALNPEH